MGAARTVLRDPGQSPSSLPGDVAAAEGWSRGVGPPATESAPLTLFLTVDTEDAYFERPRLMTGDGIGRDYGVYGILDELEAHSMRGTFFVNVYESERQPAGSVAAVVREIAERGHEVGLHTHPSPALDFYRRPLFRLERAAQEEILRWGAGRIESWTGQPPVSFRAGGYALNEETFEALASAGLKIDSSWFFPSPNNHMDRSTINAVTLHRSLVEVPVTTVLRESGPELLEQRKLDLDWLTTAQLHAGLAALADGGARFAMFMMHSFSFIEKRTRMPDEERSPDALFTSEPLFNRYVEVYGPKPRMRVAFRDFLSGIAAMPEVQVRTLGEAHSDLLIARSPDLVPIVPA